MMAEQDIRAEMSQLYARLLPNPETYKREARAYCDAALNRMRQQARSRPKIDQQATEDKAAVAAAVRGEQKDWQSRHLILAI